MLICLRLCINIRSFIKARFDLFFSHFFQSYELIYSKYSFFFFFTEKRGQSQGLSSITYFESCTKSHSNGTGSKWRFLRWFQYYGLILDWEIGRYWVPFIATEIKSTSSFSQAVRMNWFEVQVEDFGINLKLNLTSQIIILHIYGIDLECLFRIKWLLTLSNRHFYMP